MRKLLQLLVLLLMAGGAAQAQSCTPNPLYVLAGLPGVYPNPAIQSALASGNQGQAYTETFTILVPADTTIDLSALIGFPFPPVSVSVNYQEVTAITGLPSGLTHTCNPSNCQWTGGTNGCVLVSGVPTQGGTFNVGMTTAYNVTVPGAVPVIGGQAVSIPIPGLGWTMDVTAVGVEDPHAKGFVLSPNAPNPFDGITRISFSSPKPCTVAFDVMDLSGRSIHSTSFRASSGDNTLAFDGSALAPGIYLYKLSSGDNYAVGKMVAE